MKKFIMYGAGNIGRGFIGQLFSQSGYSVGFIDINKEVIARLNADKEYPVEIVTTEGVTEDVVKNAYGIDGTDIELVSEEIATSDIMATAIGVNVLKFIAKPIALGLKKRFERNAGFFNIIICENLIGADYFLKGLIKEQIPEYADRIDKEVGFVEASIGRMVPVMTEEKKQGNPLRVCVEPYNILPVDKDAFKGEIPEVKNLYPFAPFNLFIQRKLFMHNMSHALCAYLGYQRNYEYIYEAVGDYDIKCVAFNALCQSAMAVAKENGVEIESLISHAQNLLYRFSNVALGDTVARVGKDTIRKLGANDRLIGAINLADKHNVNCEYLCLGVALGMRFAPDGDERSQELCAFAKENGARKTLEKYSEYNGRMTDLICEFYDMSVSGKSVEELIRYCEEKVGKPIRV
ncbi:MAG: mannitol dehydrogenase [Clostridiales bacterium]|nr:mannitol dehydrogenase [Clostridiales bacterium]